MLKLSHVTNGTGRVSVVVTHTMGGFQKQGDYDSLAITAEEAIDLAAELLIHARNLQDGVHDASDKGRVITTKGALYHVKQRDDGVSKQVES